MNNNAYEGDMLLYYFVQAVLFQGCLVINGMVNLSG